MTTSSQVWKAEKIEKIISMLLLHEMRDALLDIIKEELVAKSLIFKGILDDNQDAALRCGIICGTPSS